MEATMSDRLPTAEHVQGLADDTGSGGCSCSVVRALVLLARDYNRAMLALQWEYAETHQLLAIEWAAVRLPGEGSDDGE